MAVLANARTHEPVVMAADAAFRADVLRGLAQAPKVIPARWFYDLRGSRLFEEITALPEYYPTRVETGLLRAHAREIAGMVGYDPVIVEFGSGSSIKTCILLAAVARATYVPIEICGEFLVEACARLAERFPQVAVLPIEADFTKPIRLPVLMEGGRLGPGDRFGHGHGRSHQQAQEILGFFPGSTIGNLAPAAAVDLLRAMRATLGQGARLLIGIDRIKDRQRLVAAYDDAAGVTARFNLNLLERINRELHGSIPLDEFVHQVRWNEDRGRIEMHLAARRDIAFAVDGRTFHMTRSETIHTENCHKYTPDQIRVLLDAGGWHQQRHWTDPAGDFSLVLAIGVDEPMGP